MDQQIKYGFLKVSVPGAGAAVAQLVEVAGLIPVGVIGIFH
jgi:hypothetical protein